MYLYNGIISRGNSMNKPEIIIILAGSLQKNAKGHWESDTKDFHHLRIIAGNLLHKKNPNSKIIVSGGRGILDNVLPKKQTLASILKEELTKLGVPFDKIIEEKQSNNTIQQLQQLEKMLANQRSKNIIIISNRYHIPRIQTMIEYKKIKFPANTNLISAEAVLIKEASEEWEEKIKKIYQNPAMKAIIQKEKRGLRNLSAGKYKFTFNTSMKFRKATIGDAKILFEWRNDPKTRANSFNTEPILWKNHIKWLEKILANPNHVLLLYEKDKKPVGTVRIDMEENSAELSWTVAPKARGQKIGKQMIKQAAKEFDKTLTTQIKKENIASIKIAQHAGFILKSQTKELTCWEHAP